MSVERLIEQIRLKLDPQQASLSGLVGSSISAILSLYDDILIVAATTEKAQQLKAEIQFFSGRQVQFFPAPDINPGEEFKPSKEIVGQRQVILDLWQKNEPLVVVAPLKAVLWKTSQELRSIRLSVDKQIRIDALIIELIEAGYKRFDIVGEKGEFSVRGGIVDVFPLNVEQPIRLELLDDKIETIRQFDVFSQRSKEKLTEVTVLPAFERFEEPLVNHLPKQTKIVFVEPIELKNAEQKLNFGAPLLTPTIELSALLIPGDQEIFGSAENYQGRFQEIPAEAIVVSKHASRLKDELKGEVVEGQLRGGFKINGLELITDKELFGETPKLKFQPATKEGVADELLADLKPGDYVVHENYGIALYQGMGTLDIDDSTQEYLILKFAKEDKVYVPPSQAGLIEKYSSGGDFKPKLSSLGTKNWLLTRNKIKKEIKDMTKELLSLYAVRHKLPGFAFPDDEVWQQELKATFPFEETRDQQQAITDVYRDMGSSHPMDRLICGDVGYGKTEVAMRGAAKAVAAGKQVAILVPTTILAEQHYTNFKERFKTSPFVVEMLSRFKSKKDQATIVKALGVGGVDIVVGTHRLFSKDIKFKDLGLLIVDEEQRFGVKHKEKLKQLKKTVDVLTMSATPIPRTLYMSLSGARDLSTINTPPVDRSPIRTYVLPWSETVIQEAILREIDRGGQVYFVHNFVETIAGVASKIKKLVPEARVTVGHGQMSEKELEKTMLDFLDRKYDVLVCTSIIESGLDITNVNTILIDNASRFGLSQLYQIRGRVGRSTVRAYAYLFYHKEQIISDGALERLKAIQEFTALGSGYKLAMRDLEIRGAGNLLGAQQSGHIAAVGFDLYCELLEEAVREVKGIKEPTVREVIVDLKVEAFIPPKYVTDERQRIALYRRLNLVSSANEVKELREEMRERFGALPAPAARLFDVINLRLKAQSANIRSIKEEANCIIIEYHGAKRKKVEIKGQDKIMLAELSIAG
ncbi:MAG: transcription-repair coupling factor [bacterium]